MKPPHAAKSQRLVSSGPHLLEIAQLRGWFDLVPVVDHIQQVATLAAGHADFVRAVSLPALRGNATLIRKICERHGLTIWYDESSYYEIDHRLSLR